MIVIAGHGYRLGVSAEYGGTILFCEATVAGRTVPLFVPLTTPELSKNGGAFVMAPFTNRIVGGTFVFGGDRYAFPMNRPEQDVAIHGFSRDRAWQVVDRSPDRVVLRDEGGPDGTPWTYAVTQTIALTEMGVEVELEIRNLGDRVMPFGIGLHPWFPRAAGTRLTIPAEGRFSLDDRALPCPPFHPQDTDSRDAQDWIGVDEALVGATAARIDWPTLQTRVEIVASGAFRHLHLFVPPAREVFCIEPVSHLPDVLNRPDLGDGAAMTPLSPGETLRGAATFRAAAM